MMRRDVFQAIADPTRRQIISLLAKRPLTMNSVAAHFKISRPAVSKHMRILHECELVTLQNRGRERVCEARLAPLKAVADWVSYYDKFWDNKLTGLKKFVEGK
jgi:DNA-binding transcriptional ArsR family regulator